ncbi:MAG: hypothetical protein KDD77_02510 [Caldilineaceae bacterium]|nr:hypothetical protein [Caldilineaceae bacterium]
MATKTGQTALSTAMRGGKVTERQAQSALGQAVTKIANLTKKAETSKEAMMETGTLVLHTAETQGSLFLASMAEGYFGEDKLKLGSVDLRAPVGLLAQGYGLYQTMSGQKGSGSHVLALGNGVMGSWLATVARNAGRTLAEKKAGAAQAQQPAPAQVPTVVMQGVPALPGPSLLPEPGLAGPLREVLLTPEPASAPELGRKHRRRRARGGGRFVRAAAEDHDDFDDHDQL